jgi:glyoxylate utilization-related uncharacterized protein
MRLFFTPDGDHVYGQWDMHETLASNYWHYFYGDGVQYSSCAGLSAKLVTTIKIHSTPETDWTLVLNGTEIGGLYYDVSKTYFEQALACQFGADHEATYTDSKGRVWEGMPLWFLAGFVDDADQHSSNSFNDAKALAGYQVLITAVDGYSVAIDSADIIRNSDYIVANSLNGTHIPDSDSNWPLRLVGPAISGPNSISQIVRIELLKKAASGPGLDIELLVNGEDADVPPGVLVAVGDEVTFSYVVKNTGNVALTNILVDDITFGILGTIPSLASGATAEPFTKVVTAKKGFQMTTGRAEAKYDGQWYSDWDYGKYTGQGGLSPSPGLDIEVLVNGEDADVPPGVLVAVGDEVTFSYIVKNTGNVALTNVAVDDTTFGSIGTIASLDPGATADPFMKVVTAEKGFQMTTGRAEAKYDGQWYSDWDYGKYTGKIAGTSTPISGKTSSTGRINRISGGGGISKTSPSINWPDPADIAFGTPLSSIQLNATSEIEGTFVYTPAAGTVLEPGNDLVLSVTFTPEDGLRYNVVTKDVTLNVTEVLSQVATVPSLDQSVIALAANEVVEITPVETVPLNGFSFATSPKSDSPGATQFLQAPESQVDGPAQTTNAPVQEGRQSNNLPLIAGIIAAIAVAGLTFFILRKKRHA